MKKFTFKIRNNFRAALYVFMALSLIAGLGVPVISVKAANPAPQQIYFIPLPEDDLLQLFDDDDAAGGTFPDPVSPIRSITSISISSSGTWVYYDQWEDGGYEATISEPGANVYSNPGNLDGTQIWGDGVLANGCPPSINNVPNACLVAADDQLDSGDVIILDNNVAVNGTTPGPYSRSATAIFFDGRDKFGTTFPVAVTRGAFPLSPGSVMAGATEVLDTLRWGTSYEAPLGENTSASNTSAFEDVRWFIMAGVGGATINVDANGDGDVLDANDLNGLVMTQGAKRQVNGILMGATLTVTSGSPVQVSSMTADVDDTFEFRWDALLPRSAWSNNYLTPVGTAPKTSNSGCTEVEVYNPNTAGITIYYDFPGGASPDGSFAVQAKTTATGQTTPPTPLVPYNNGGRYWSAGGQQFLPISVTDCTRDTSGTDGRLYDWGTPLFPVDELTDQALIGFAPGCSNESLVGICEDADVTTNNFSRSVVWVTPLANTTLYVDTNGSGITCPGGVGAEQTVPANALVSVRIDDDPTAANKVRDDFGSQAYNLNTGNQNWTTNWIETGDDGSPSTSTGSIYITGGTLRLQNTTVSGGTDAGDRIERQANLSGQIFADLTFQLTSSGTLDANDDLALDISQDGGATWRNLRIFEDDPSTSTQVKANIISPYAASNTRIRFRIIDELEAGDYWNIDQVQIKYAANGDYDMTGSRIITCDGTVFASAWGQDPALSGSNDEEALDMGTGVAPFGTRITLDKYADKTQVPVGGPVTYTFAVQNRGTVALSNIQVIDNKCSPAVYLSGDTNGNSYLDPLSAETWLFTCSSNIFVDTTNVAYATGWTGIRDIVSAPDQWTVTVIQDAVIGNYVWLDEDGDGDQDAGESGIANMKVELCTDAACTTVVQTTYTDTNGGYLFDGLNAGTYYVRTTPSASLNPTYDEDGTGTANISMATVVAGNEHLTADFGYNWSTPPETNTNTGTGAIGDRVWIDADGDGVQDGNEAGLAGVPVELWYDSDGNGAIDSLLTSTLTGTAGSYIFDNLPAGIYEVRAIPPAGYTQTGDPDENLDNRTSEPLILAPGDVYVNADFGYRPDPGTFGSIGDTVWLDANRDNIKNVGEQGIAGVTVALIDDLDGDGYWDAGEPIIAVDITDENGYYNFPGLPTGASADYLVWVNDTEDVLGELSPSYDVLDGANQGNPSMGLVTGLEISAVQNLTTTPVTTADFAYAPPGHQPGEGLIGDTIFLDRNNNGLYDPGEGLEGVKVNLTEPGFDGILGTADDTVRYKYTDENGGYAFGELEPSLSYRVSVDTTTLPAGVTNTIDPDGTTDSTAVVNLGAAGNDGVNDPDGLNNGINLGIDFAYRDLSSPNTISGTIWEDTNADGILTESGRFGNVTIVLRNSAGNVVATTTTDSNGNYSFTNLPDGTFTVDVTDDNNVLNGYWKSIGPNPGVDNNSQIEPYTVSVAGGQTNVTADFGYYNQPAAVGNRVWFDADGDGVQDVGEEGVGAWPVTLTITWPNAVTTIIKTYTDVNGYYNFENLLQDEDFDGSGTGEPIFTLSVPLPEDYLPRPADYSGTTDVLDSDGILSGTDAAVVIGTGPNSASLVVKGTTNLDYDFGLVATPTAITLPSDPDSYISDAIHITWETADESTMVGFRLYRQAAGEELQKLADIEAQNRFLPFGAKYDYADTTAMPDMDYTYWLEVLWRDGSTTMLEKPAKILVLTLKYYAPLIVR